MNPVSRIPPAAARAIGTAISRRYERRMPGNPFPPDSPWGCELDRMHREDRAAERFRREYARQARREARAAR